MEARLIGDRVCLCLFHRDSGGARRSAIVRMASTGTQVHVRLPCPRLLPCRQSPAACYSFTSTRKLAPVRRQPASCRWLLPARPSQHRCSIIGSTLSHYTGQLEPTTWADPPQGSHLQRVVSDLSPLGRRERLVVEHASRVLHDTVSHTTRLRCAQLLSLTRVK